MKCLYSFRYTFHSLFALFSGLLLLLTACGPTVTPPKAQQTVVISPSFQAQLSPVPTQPAYRCGAWSSNNAPGGYSTITIYAKLTKNLQGVSGATARAIVHFRENDVQLDQQPASDNGGYVSFSLPLQGRQPSRIPATIDVVFTVSGKDINCTQAFFTPQ